MFVLEHLWIIPLLPLLGAAANGLFGRASLARGESQSGRERNSTISGR